MSAAKTPELRTEVKKVYEAIRYSDPMSNATLEEINEQIQNQFSVFEDAVKSEDSELASSSSEELIVLMDKRNKKCKLIKSSALIFKVSYTIYRRSHCLYISI